MFIEKQLKANRIPRSHCKNFILFIIIFVIVMLSFTKYLRTLVVNHNTIPKILHKTTRALDEKDIQTSFFNECREMYTDDGWEVKLWMDDDIDKFVMEEFPQYYIKFIDITPKIKQIDAVRYLFMYRYGGIYTDMDSECIRSPTAFVEGIEKGSTAWISGYPETFFLMSTPGNRFWIFAFELILRDWKKYNVRSTGGPQGLNRMAKAYVAIHGQDALRPFVMYDETECDRIEPHGDVKCGEPTYRWIEAKNSFKESNIKIYDKIGFIPNKIVDPLECLSRIGSCKYSHCHARKDVTPFLFVHHCLFSWRGQGKG